MLKPTQVVVVIIQHVNIQKHASQSGYVRHMHFLTLSSSAKHREGNSLYSLYCILLQAQSHEIRDGGSRNSFEIKSETQMEVSIF